MGVTKLGPGDGNVSLGVNSVLAPGSCTRWDEFVMAGDVIVDFIVVNLGTSGSEIQFS